MTACARDRLIDVARRFDTPAYVYDWPAMEQRAKHVSAAFRGVAEISYAVKANPNCRLLSLLAGHVSHFDVSSIGELARLSAAGVPASRVSFTGPGKRDVEIARAVSMGVGHLVCESTTDLERVSARAGASGRRQPVVLRVNPRELPPKFAAHMGGGASQFGIDEENVPDVLAGAAAWPGVRIDGLHVYAGSNCLSLDALARHFELTIDLFDRLARHMASRPTVLIVGSAFGIAYHPGDVPLDVDAVGTRLRPLLASAAERPRLTGARWMLEMGRYLVADSGVLLASVLRLKTSRGVNIAVLDAGFNNHLAAAGLLGSLLRRNWPVTALTADGPTIDYTLVGPLCTSIDTLGTRVALPALREGDILAIGASGAYGVTASPTRFISHPEPREIILLDDGATCDATEHAHLAASW